MKPSARTVCEIQLDHLAQNFKFLSGLGGGFCCPMVKADAYGHGAVEVSIELERAGAQQLGVMFPEEGIELREAGIRTPILVFGGVEREYLDEVLPHQLTPVVSSWHQLKELETLDLQQAIPIHLKVDTGMHRLGFQPSEARKIFDRLWKNKKLRLAGILTHFSHGDDICDTQGITQGQISLFAEFAESFLPFKPILHCLASGPLMALNSKKTLSLNERSWLEHYGTRPGLALYGINPTVHGSKSEIKPVMSIKSRVVAFQRVKKGDTVSYGGTWRAERDSLIGVIPFGYADGLPRRASNRISFRRGHELYPQVGTVCMDYCLVDLGSSRDEFNLGDELVIFDGKTPTTVTELAVAADTIAYEILTGIGPRVQRRMVRATR